MRTKQFSLKTQINDYNNQTNSFLNNDVLIKELALKITQLEEKITQLEEKERVYDSNTHQSIEPRGVTGHTHEPPKIYAINTKNPKPTNFVLKNSKKVFAPP
ncbi:hypothetical protein C2G38_2123645 [Gigaspora rosea]|uniref:Uncharacterized protein n=1 Tax=Gigaspora rosea TaxID=44941 RepID=A0A397U776_9GLOM|nr:hypothetical protein C2G38_2123645 [Gigaspora rosea]